MLDRNTIEELNELSLLTFGSKSKWRKLVEKGEAELVTEATKRMGADGKYETIETPQMYVGPNGGEVKISTIKRYTVESVRERMLSMKAQREAIYAAWHKQQNDAKATEEAKKAVSKAAGTAAI